MPPVAPTPSRQRVPAAERRDALIDAAVIEFAHGGLHGTPVDRIARRVGVAQPYVFSLFHSKRELFLAAVQRSFARVGGAFEAAAADFEAGRRTDCESKLEALGLAYVELLESERALLMMQHHAYAACDDDVVRERVRALYAQTVALVERLSGEDTARLDEFFRTGMWLNVAAALGVEDLSAGCEWIRDEPSA